MSRLRIFTLNKLWALSVVVSTALMMFTACTQTGEKFVPENSQETIALSAVTIKAFAKSVKLAYNQRLISQEAAQAAHDRLQVAQSALISAKAATSPQDQQTALAVAQQALTLVAAILENMQEPAP